MAKTMNRRENPALPAAIKKTGAAKNPGLPFGQAFNTALKPMAPSEPASGAGAAVMRVLHPGKIAGDLTGGAVRIAGRKLVRWFTGLVRRGVGKLGANPQGPAARLTAFVSAEVVGDLADGLIPGGYGRHLKLVADEEADRELVLMLPESAQSFILTDGELLEDAVETDALQTSGEVLSRTDGLLIDETDGPGNDEYRGF